MQQKHFGEKMWNVAQWNEDQTS